MGHLVKRSHRKHKSQKSESEEYDSLGSDTESGSGDHIRSRLDQSMHLDDHEPASFLSMCSLFGFLNKFFTLSLSNFVFFCILQIKRRTK